MREARRGAGGANGDLSETERGELARLRKENTELRTQRDVLIRHAEAGGRTGRAGRLVMSWPSRFSLRQAQTLGVSGPSSMLWWFRVGRGSSSPAR